MATKQQPLFTGTEWTPEAIEAVAEVCAEIAENELRLDYFPFQIEIITSDQMAGAFVTHGLPAMYRHWSFGKRYAGVSHTQRQRGSPLAYEMVINSNPCIVYCMDRNTMTMQTLVIAHAAFGHNAFFKNNFLFQQWTRPDAIVDFAAFAEGYIASCEDKYGMEEVEQVLDACHALWRYGVDRAKRPPERTERENEERRRARREAEERDMHPLRQILPKTRRPEAEEEADRTFPEEPQENLLYFIEKNAPELPQWKREIVRIVRRFSQYFYPQPLTKGMNEGFATFVHYYLMTRLHEKGLITDGAFQEFLDNHTKIIKQPEFDETVRVKRKNPTTGEEVEEQRPIYRGLNPYALWFTIFMDVKRMCEDPTDEDREWFPHIAGGDWVDVIKHAVANFKDESGIRQFLSPKVMRDWRLFSVLNEADADEVVVTAIHDTDGYRKLREILAAEYEWAAMVPEIEVTHVDRRGDRTLILRHDPLRGRPLHESDARKVVTYFATLWEFPVMLETVDADGDPLTIASTDDDDT